MVSGPLTLVHDALTGGARSRREIAQRTALDAAVVDACLDHLVRMGRLTAETLSSGCPSGGCGSCPSAEDASGCSQRNPTRGPVLISLGRR
ncbi:hypothetical protein IPV09_12305 [Tessaracoccus sp. SD287]|nr:hypothetical protein [Tessaracoccus sp. SD287]